MNQEPKEISRPTIDRQAPGSSGAQQADVFKPADKRNVCRRRQLKGGQIAYQDGHMTLDCMVRDLTDSGARIKVIGSVSPPDYFTLTVELDGLSADCDVIWCAGPLLGVRFVEALRKTKITRLQVINRQTNEARLRKS